MGSAGSETRGGRVAVISKNRRVSVCSFLFGKLPCVDIYDFVLALML